MNINYYNVSRTMSDDAILTLAVAAEKYARIAESKNDRSAVVHYHCILSAAQGELERRERAKK